MMLLHQSGGVNVDANDVQVDGDVVGHDKIVQHIEHYHALIVNTEDNGIGTTFEGTHQESIEGKSNKTFDRIAERISFNNADQLQPLHTLSDKMGGVLAVAFLAQGAALVSQHYDGPHRLWRISDGALLYRVSSDYSCDLFRQMPAYWR